MNKDQVNVEKRRENKVKQERLKHYSMEKILQLNSNKGKSPYLQKEHLLDKKRDKIHSLVIGIRRKWQQVERFLHLHNIQIETINQTQQTISSKLKAVDKVNRLMDILHKACSIQKQKVAYDYADQEPHNGFERIMKDDEDPQNKTSDINFSNNSETNDRNIASSYNRSYSKICTPTFSENCTTELSEIINSKIRNQSEGNLLKTIEGQNLIPTFMNISVLTSIKGEQGVKLFDQQTQTEQILVETPQMQDKIEMQQLGQMKKNSKRIYKSILKIALKSISICNNLLNRAGHNQQYEELKNSINLMMSKFNEQYYLRDISCDMQFIQSMIKDTKKIYEKISSLCK